jgi:hypothetical protein
VLTEKMIDCYTCLLPHYYLYVKQRQNAAKIMTGSIPIDGRSLAALYPELSKESVGWDPTTVSAGSHKKIKWRCDKNHEWFATVYNRALADSGCPVCSGRQVLAGYNDLVTTYPELSKESVGWDPTTVCAGSDQKKRWRCNKGHEWDARVAGRTLGRGCPVCSGRQVLAGYNDLVTTHPELSKESVGWDPTTVSAGSRKKMRWRCNKGHEWFAAVKDRSGDGNGCPVCSSHQVLAGYNDLVTTYPELSKESVGWDPTTVSAGSRKKMRWRCNKGHEWDARVSSRALADSGCPVCSGRQVLAGYNDLVTTYPELSKESVGWDPTTVSAGSRKKMRWRCNKGHEWFAAVKGRSGDGNGCSSCTTYGFDPNLPGWLYFIEHDGWGMLQIGITNYPDSRLGKHVRAGWEPLEIRGPMKGALTRNLETDILRSLARRDATFANKTDCTKFDGWSEAWTKSSLLVTSLNELLEFVYTDDLA